MLELFYFKILAESKKNIKWKLNRHHFLLLLNQSDIMKSKLLFLEVNKFLTKRKQFNRIIFNLKMNNFN